MDEYTQRILNRAMLGGAIGMITAMLIGSGLFALSLQGDGIVELLVGITRAVWGGVIVSMLLAPLGVAVALYRGGHRPFAPALLTFASMLVALVVSVSGAPDVVTLPALVVFGVAAPIVGTGASLRLSRSRALVAA